MIKDIVVNLSIGKPEDVASSFAVSTASLFEAHLSAVAFAYEPPVSGTMFDGLTPAAFDAWVADRKAAADDAEQAFHRSARLAGISADCRVLSKDVPGAARAFSAIARNYDLSIVAQARPDDDLPESLVAETALFESGRPVLIVPYIQTTGIKLERVLVCWDGGRNAARAVGDALPLLQKAGQISVVTVEQREQRGELLGAQIAEHLARHDLNVDLNTIVAPDTDTANAILSHAADRSADLIVMGGYGHTRLREFILGGVTRSILGSMTVPVLMSH